MSPFLLFVIGLSFGLTAYALPGPVYLFGGQINQQYVQIGQPMANVSFEITLKFEKLFSVATGESTWSLRNYPSFWPNGTANMFENDVIGWRVNSYGVLDCEIGYGSSPSVWVQLLPSISPYDFHTYLITRVQNAYKWYVDMNLVCSYESPNSLPLLPGFLDPSSNMITFKSALFAPLTAPDYKLRPNFASANLLHYNSFTGE